jgi:hypothetical protein
MTRFPRLVLVLLAGAALSACAGMPVINYSYVAEHYEPELLGYPASRGGLYTEVVGNPFKADKAALDTRVTEAFEAAHFGPVLDFVTEKPAGDDPAYRVVVLFNPARHANAARLCSSADRPQSGRAPGEVGVMAAFCSSDSRISSTVGRVSGAQALDDPAFGRLLAQVGLSLFPPAPGVRMDEPMIIVP